MCVCYALFVFISVYACAHAHGSQAPSSNHSDQPDRPIHPDLTIHSDQPINYDQPTHPNDPYTQNDPSTPTNSFTQTTPTNLTILTNLTLYNPDHLDYSDRLGCHEPDPDQKDAQYCDVRAVLHCFFKDTLIH